MQIVITFVLFLRKTKHSELTPNENKENYSLPVTSSPSPSTHDKTLTDDKVHLDITEHHSSDKSLLIYDLNESTTRDLSTITHSPQKVKDIVTITRCIACRRDTHSLSSFSFLIKNDYDFDQLSDNHHDIHLLSFYLIIRRVLHKRLRQQHRIRLVEVTLIEY